MMNKSLYVAPLCESLSLAQIGEILAGSQPSGVTSGGNGEHEIGWGGDANDPGIDPDARARNDFQWGSLWG